MAEPEPIYSKPRKEKNSLIYDSMNDELGEEPDYTEMKPIAPTEDGEPPYYPGDLAIGEMGQMEVSDVDIFSNPIAEEQFENKHFEYKILQAKKPPVGKSIKFAICCSCLAIFLVLLLLLALIGFCVFIWFEVSDLKAAPAISSPEQITSSSLSAQVNTLNASTDAFFQQLLRNLSIIDSRMQQLSTSAEQELGFSSLSNTFTGQLNSSVSVLIQQLLQDTLAAQTRSQQQELRLAALEGNLNSSIDLLSQNLLRALDTRSQQQELELNALEVLLNSSQQFLQNSLQQQGVRLNTLEGQLNSSMDALTQQLLRESYVSGNRTQEVNSTLYRQVNSVQNQTMMILDGMLGQFSSFPIRSCSALPPNTPSNYYWVMTTNGSAVRVFCDMTRSCGGVTGGWTRLYFLDMTDINQRCPSGIMQRTDGSFRTCGIALARSAAGCTSVNLRSNSLSYSRICGRIKAYQVGSSDTFGNTGRGTNVNINGNYVDGVSLTYGDPRQHIWTFAAGLDEVATYPQYNCPCTNTQRQTGNPPIPSFVGNDYFCDTGSSGRFEGDRFYGDDPLWDGAGCGPLNSCCTLNTPPWFHKQLPRPTTSNIEMRVCRDQHAGDEDTAIEVIEMYVQ